MIKRLGGVRAVTITISADAYQKIKRASAILGMKQYRLVDKAVSDFLEKAVSKSEFEEEI